MPDTFSEIAAILLTAVVIGALGTFLRQPLIVSFIAVGVLVGPAGIGLVTQHEEIELLASIGISLLLFVVGLKLDFHLVRTIGPVALATGVGQILFTSIIGFFIALALGMTPLTATYVSVALTFSSTIIIVKLLSDKREIDALHGRIAVGMLIVQDIAVILAMIGITALAAGGTERIFTAEGLLVALAGLLFLGGIAALAVWVLPALTARISRSPELLVLFAIAWAVALAAAGEVLGFSREVGAFVAGASLASTPYREAIGSRLVSVRDFLLLFFFIDLGARLDISLLGVTLGAAIILSAFVLIGNPLIVMAIMSVMGYRKRTGFLTGLTVAQISEFSLILGALGLSVGHIDEEAMGLITTVGLVTIGLSTYMILYSHRLYEWIGPALGLFERRVAFRELATDAPVGEGTADVVIFGLGRYGSGIMAHLLERGRRVAGVDFDPDALARWRAAGVPVYYGDATDPELFEHLPIDHARWVVSTAPDLDASRTLLAHLRARGFRGRVAVSLRSAEEAEASELGHVDLLLRPYADAAEQAADAIMSAADQLSVVAELVPDMREVRLVTGMVWAGRRLEEMRLRETFGVTALAVSRAGQGHLNPGPDFQLFPGDRVVLAGEPDALAQAVEYLSRREEVTGGDQEFVIDEVPVAGSASAWAGQSLATLELPRRFGVTVLAVAPPAGPFTVAAPHRPLSPGDRLVVGGSREALQRMRQGTSDGVPKFTP
jgi:Kef-type K+ transport system membrane component KefB/Trk K+ transport system NAD-binding subunit